MTVAAAKCEHGVSADDDRAKALEGVVFAAPFTTCACCGFTFPYVDHACWTIRDGVSEGSGTSWEPKDRCAECGGRYVRWGAPKP